jgi:valyl-tRNA synthetase
MFDTVFPMDVRPQGHDIIRTWLFSTMVRSHFEHGVAPWRNATLSGWILDPDRKKMSKSRGNVVTPIDLFEQYGSDAVRYWAASARPGVDTAFSEDQMKVGRKLATKLLNVSKFVLSFGEASGTATHPLDTAMLSRLDGVVRDATAAFEAFDYARALERTEAFFWWFCDDYVEIVKTRAYGEGADTDSARIALRTALSVMQRLFAPHLPFVTEEVWGWWQSGSIHRSEWPQAFAPSTVDDADELLDVVCEVLAVVRRTKTEAKVSQRAAVEHVEIRATDAQRALLVLAEGDLRNAGGIASIGYVSHAGERPETIVRLAPPADDA